MLGELAITPDVYRESSFADSAAAAVAWDRLRHPLMHECLLRNLYEGEMCRSLLRPGVELSPMGKELLKKSAGRRRRVPKIAESMPQNDTEWCAEAVASAGMLPLDCIVTTPSTKAHYVADELVADAGTIDKHPWWENRGPSIRLERKTDDYLRVLGRVLQASNSLMIIDPHLDPSRQRYSEVWKLLERCHRPEVPVRVEIHRGCSVGSGKDTRIVSVSEWTENFNDELLPDLKNINLKLKLVIWPELHDRYLISDLMGILLPNGFDVSRRPKDKTTWTRLSRRDRDDVQREFDADYCPSGTNHGVVDLLP